jgi:hypothetical protein
MFGVGKTQAASWLTVPLRGWHAQPVVMTSNTEPNANTLPALNATQVPASPHQNMPFACLAIARSFLW